MDRLLPITRWRRRPTTGVDNIDRDIGRKHNLGCPHLGTAVNIGARRLDNDVFPASNFGTRFNNDVDNNDCG